MAILNLTIDAAEYADQKSSFDPIPVGWYTATVFEIEAVTIAQGANAGKVKLKVQFKIADDSPVAAGRRAFADINTFGGISGPNSKNPGKPYGPFDLYAFGGALGLGADDFAALDLDTLQGSEIQVQIAHRPKRVQDAAGAWVDSDEIRDYVKGYRSADAGATAKAATKAPSKAKAAGFKL